MTFDDDLDLALAGRLIEATDFDAGDDLPVFPPVPRSGWWTTTVSDEHHLDLPPFTSGADRARWMIREMARAALAGVEGSGEDDRVFETRDGLRSLNELLRGVGGDAVDAITAFVDR